MGLEPEISLVNGYATLSSKSFFQFVIKDIGLRRASLFIRSTSEYFFFLKTLFSLLKILAIALAVG